MLTNYQPVFEIKRLISTPTPVAETFTVCYLNAPDPNQSLRLYTKGVRNIHQSTNLVFDETLFMNDWWNRMSISLKGDLYAIRKVQSDHGPFVIYPADIQSQFLSAAQFSEFSWVV